MGLWIANLIDREIFKKMDSIQMGDSESVLRGEQQWESGELDLFMR